MRVVQQSVMRSIKRCLLGRYRPFMAAISRDDAMLGPGGFSHSRHAFECQPPKVGAVDYDSVS
jgi:hypothetical protein